MSHKQESAFDIIAFDADDTLWHNEIYYKQAEEKLAELLADYHPAEFVVQELFKTETRNTAAYGYGIKSFTLSMIETAIALTEEKITTEEICEIIGFGREMISADVELIPNVRETIQALSASHMLMIITKGDLLDQERKVVKSGLGDCFKHIEVVSEKTSDIYKALLSKYEIAPERFLMVGNSLKSDVLPIVAIGGAAVYIPNGTTWAHETVSDEEAQKNYYHELEDIGQLPELIKNLSNPKE
ncbi:MAG: HAD family hydrolase [Anaerolineae bacterium]|jgi:putative hydrolase of the HAD superfamily|nr:HAD family hydrolase [Anaerolineae bacterium]MBT7075933.1 HAD family hydrolase [Anaerolineae bacterium]MBT7991731.1 HAD family hydrolase [Anaerolineae bacterium]